MVITVQKLKRRWRVVHPQQAGSRQFECGVEAFDAAAALARDHHLRTGACAAVRVQAFSTTVEALRVG